MSAERGALVTAALLGTDRRPFDHPAAGGRDPAVALLEEAARLAMIARAGMVLPRTAPVIPIEADEIAQPANPANPAAQDLLGRLLVRPQNELVMLWLRAAARHQVRVAPRLWPAVLGWASRSRIGELDPLVAALGARGVWFAEQNPAWSRLGAQLRHPPPRPPAPSALVVQPPDLPIDPDLVGRIRQPWSPALTRAALDIVAQAPLRARRVAYAVAVGLQMPLEHYPLARAAAEASRGSLSALVREAFAALDRTLFARVEIHNAFEPDPIVLDAQEYV